jgi:moderate conductance mechanosensitive channel
LDNLYANFQQFTLAHAFTFHIILASGKIVLLYILARLAIHVVSKVSNRFLNLRAVKMDNRRRNTLLSLLDNVIRYTIYFIFLLMVLSILGIHIATLLAGAGIVGVALGFGAQSIIKDVLTGFFILFEDQYGVGDVVQINNFTGTVLTIGLRLTRIQAWTGEVEIIPNGQIQQVRNYSKTNSVAVVDVSVSYDTNLDEAMRVLRDVMEGIRKESTDVVGEVQILGVQSLDQSHVTLRVTAECLPTKNFGIQRLAMKKIKETFDHEGLEIPVPQSVVSMQPNAPKNS